MDNTNLEKFINKELEFLEEENDFLIDSFANRTKTRIKTTFSKNKLTIGMAMLDTLIDENLSNMLHEVNKETCNKYYIFLNKVYRLLEEHIISKKMSKDTLKHTLKSLINKIKNMTNITITISQFDNFKEILNSKIALYDNNNLNIEITKIIDKGIEDIVKSLNDSNNEFIIKQIHYYVKEIVSAR